MLPTSLTVVLFTVAFTLVPTLVMLWGWRQSFFSDLDAQSRVIFEGDDLRLERPWEAAADRLTREVAYGPPAPPAPGEWGEGREPRSPTRGSAPRGGA